MDSELRRKEFSIQYLPSYPPVTILCLCVSFLSLLFLPSVSNPQAPSLECTNLPQLGWLQELPPKGGSHMVAQNGVTLDKFSFHFCFVLNSEWLGGFLKTQIYQVEELKLDLLYANWKLFLWHSVGIHGINMTGYFLTIFRPLTPMFPLKYYFEVTPWRSLLKYSGVKKRWPYVNYYLFDLFSIHFLDLFYLGVRAGHICADT